MKIKDLVTPELFSFRLWDSGVTNEETECTFRWRRCHDAEPSNPKLGKWHIAYGTQRSTANMRWESIPALLETELELLLIERYPNVAIEIRLWPTHKTTSKFTAIAMGYDYASDCYSTSLQALIALTEWLLDQKISPNSKPKSL